MFLKLSEINDGSMMWINMNYVVRIHLVGKYPEPKTMLLTNMGLEIMVHETPDQIMDMINAKKT